MIDTYRSQDWDQYRMTPGRRGQGRAEHRASLVRPAAI
jgi:hypothetical protein